MYFKCKQKKLFAKNTFLEHTKLCYTLEMYEKCSFIKIIKLLIITVLSNGHDSVTPPKRFDSIKL